MDATEMGEWISKAVRNAEALRVEEAAKKGLTEAGTVAQREGWTGSAAIVANKHLEEMSAVGIDQMHEYMGNQGWVNFVTDPLTKEVSYEANRKMTAEKAGLAASTLKSWMESHAGGVKQLADNFLMKVNAGEDALIEGLEFAGAMRNLSDISRLVLGLDQDLGRGLAIQGVVKGNRISPLSEGLTGAAGKATEAGQELFRDKFKAIADLLNDPAGAEQGINELVALARRTQLLDDPHAISKASSGLRVLGGDVANEVMINGMLSSPTTLVTNLLGAVWVPTRALLQYGTAAVWAETGLMGAKEAGLAAAEASAQLAAMYSGFGDALQIGWKAAVTGNSLFQNQIKAIDSKAYNLAMSEKGLPGLDEKTAELVDQIGEFVRLPSKFMMGIDEAARFIGMRAEVAARGVRYAARNGVDLTDKAALGMFMDIEARRAMNLNRDDLLKLYSNTVDAEASRNIWTNLSQRYEQSILADNARFGYNDQLPSQAAAKAVFQEDNSFADTVQIAVKKVPALRPFMPFVRTPLNILKQGVWESTGAAAIYRAGELAWNNPTRAIHAIQSELLKDPNETFRMAGQIALTTSLVGAVYGGVMGGRITGGGPGRWTAGRNGKLAQDAWTAAGNVPYSIQVGDQRIPFDRFGEPLAVVMRIVADLGMYSGYMQEADQDETMASVVSIAASGLYQASFLRGLEPLVKLLQTDNEYALTDVVQNYSAAYMPFGSLLAYVDRVQDPYKAAYGDGVTIEDVFKSHEASIGELIFGKLANRLPGLGDRPQLVDQLTGRPVPIVPGIGPGSLNPLQMAIPVMPRNNQADSTWKAVFEIKGSYTEKRPPFKLTGKEQQQLNGLMARSLVGGRTLAQRVADYRRRADVEQFVASKGAMTPKAKFKVERGLDKIIREHYELALEQLLQQDNDVMTRARLYDAKGLAAESNDVGRLNDVNDQLEALYQRAVRGY